MKRFYSLFYPLLILAFGLFSKEAFSFDDEPGWKPLSEPIYETLFKLPNSAPACITCVDESMYSPPASDSASASDDKEEVKYLTDTTAEAVTTPLWLPGMVIEKKGQYYCEVKAGSRTIRTTYGIRTHIPLEAKAKPLTTATFNEADNEPIFDFFKKPHLDYSEEEAKNLLHNTFGALGIANPFLSLQSSTTTIHYILEPIPFTDDSGFVHEELIYLQDIFRVKPFMSTGKSIQRFKTGSTFYVKSPAFGFFDDECGWANTMNNKDTPPTRTIDHFDDDDGKSKYYRAIVMGHFLVTWDGFGDGSNGGGWSTGDVLDLSNRAGGNNKSKYLGTKANRDQKTHHVKKSDIPRKKPYDRNRFKSKVTRRGEAALEKAGPALQQALSNLRQATPETMADKTKEAIESFVQNADEEIVSDLFAHGQQALVRFFNQFQQAGSSKK